MRYLLRTPLFTGKLSGVREGSIAAALLVGNIIRIFNNLFDRTFGKKTKSRFFTDAR